MVRACLAHRQPLLLAHPLTLATTTSVRASMTAWPPASAIALDRNLLLVPALQFFEHEVRWLRTHTLLFLRMYLAAALLGTKRCNTGTDVRRSGHAATQLTHTTQKREFLAVLARRSHQSPWAELAVLCKQALNTPGAALLHYSGTDEL